MMKAGLVVTGIFLVLLAMTFLGMAIPQIVLGIFGLLAGVLLIVGAVTG